MRAQNTSSIGLFYKSVGMLWTASDCEELVGVFSGDDVTDLAMSISV